MIKSKTLIPEIYSESYDMSIFTGLLDLVYTAREVELLRQQGAHLPERCFEEDLSLLASLFGLPATSNRELLSKYRLLIKQKGTRPALIALAQAACGLSFIDEANNSDIKIMSKSSDSTIEFTIYLKFDSLDTRLLDVLIRKLSLFRIFVTVRPIAEYQQDVQRALFTPTKAIKRIVRKSK